MIFAGLLVDASDVLSTSELAEVCNFIDVGEYGVALETIVSIYSEEKKIKSQSVYESINRLAKMMSMDWIVDE